MMIPPDHFLSPLNIAINAAEFTELGAFLQVGELALEGEPLATQVARFQRV